MILIISGSQRKGNTLLLSELLKNEISRISNVEAKVISLANINITPCDACDICWDNNGVCNIEDDLTPILDLMKVAKILVFVTPVYFQNVSSHIKLLMDRSNSLAAIEALKNKIGFAVSVGSMRNGGQEFALSSLINFFLAHKMIVASGTSGENKVGLKGWSKSPEKLNGIADDELFMKNLTNFANRIIELSTLIPN